ncbi:MAG: hypothetical protein LKF07_06565 [Lacticaseibacillus paracasei]|jgi:TM2 domain-containing membrane protein YozV|uniref:hypothetical protein n=1 Tax=Lacticaseibacillus paracasei TaxID=1597 RepID=UPI0022E18EBA|nr:hypothetical protein [Lacticaseibacillus paracasei]MCH4000697.1 hypothetical protein [Lacticaseibacillus paracasei]MCH4042791.1 hypothetical protein [Lacticaseibacillus paracasei]MCH4117511.1 hypothetical protein [Lacticaseibacillus paracasei]MCI1356181.1 hypothetical protein [Lacticaseibacillus paracasei]MCI1377050.1 hypothetical protein [Lacticaseibacillus paracasei]
MKKKIKHAIAYIILAVWAGVIIYGFASFLWDLVVKPFIEIGIVKSLIFFTLFLGLATVMWLIISASEKLVKWLLKE